MDFICVWKLVFNMCVKYLLMQNVMIPCPILSYLNACPAFKSSKQLADFYQIFYKCYAIWCHPNVVHCNVVLVNNSVANARTCGVGAILATIYDPAAVSSNWCSKDVFFSSFFSPSPCKGNFFCKYRSNLVATLIVYFRFPVGWRWLIKMNRGI